MNMAGHSRIDRRFRIGVVSTCLQTALRRVLRDYTALYRAFECHTPDENEIHLAVTRLPFSLRHRPRYLVTVNQRLQFEPGRIAEVLPYVEWAANWEIPRVMPRFLQLHASALELDGQGVIFPGHSGSGKSTLTLGLLTRGWRYLCDEFALIDAQSHRVHPYPRAVCIKEAAFGLARTLGYEVDALRHHVKGFKGRVTFINPLKRFPSALGRACPIRHVIFPRYVPGALPTLIPMHRAEAALELHRVCFNLFGCQALGIDVLGGLIRGAGAHRLITGEIGATADLLTALVRQPARSAAQSA